MPSKDVAFVPTPDPLSPIRHGYHTVLWSYMGRPMGWLTKRAVEERARRAAMSRQAASDAESWYVDHAS